MYRRSLLFGWFIVFAGIATAQCKDKTVNAADPKKQTFDGFASIAITKDDMSYPGREFSLGRSALVGNAVVFYPLSNDFGIQTDVELNQFKYDNNAIDGNSMNGAIGFHGFWRDPDKGLFGIQANAARTRTDITGARYQNERYLIGPEAAYFSDRHSFYGRANYLSSSLTLDAGSFNQTAPATGFSLESEWRYFMSDHLMVSALVGYERFSRSAPGRVGYTYDFYRAGIMAEYQIQSSPISLFSQASFHRISYISDKDISSIELDESRLLMGIKYSISDKTLFLRERSGASLKNFPEFHYVDDIGG